MCLCFTSRPFLNKTLIIKYLFYLSYPLVLIIFIIFMFGMWLCVACLDIWTELGIFWAENPFQTYKYKVSSFEEKSLFQTHGSYFASKAEKVWTWRTAQIVLLALMILLKTLTVFISVIGSGLLQLGLALLYYITRWWYSIGKAP